MISGCLDDGIELISNEEPVEVETLGSYSVVAPVDTGINPYHIHFQKNESLPQWFLDKRDNSIEPSDVHASEWAWIDKDSSFEQIIQNDGSLEELLMKLKTMV